MEVVLQVLLVSMLITGSYAPNEVFYIHFPKNVYTRPAVTRGKTLIRPFEEYARSDVTIEETVLRPLKEFTICWRARISEFQERQVLFSYQLPSLHENDINEQILAIFVNRTVMVYFEKTALEIGPRKTSAKTWMSFCFIWSEPFMRLYTRSDYRNSLDNVFVNLDETEKTLLPGGIFILGRSDSSPSNHFFGDITAFNIWDYKLPKSHIERLRCHDFPRLPGNVINWNQIHLSVSNVDVVRTLIDSYDCSIRDLVSN